MVPDPSITPLPQPDLQWHSALHHCVPRVVADPPCERSLPLLARGHQHHVLLCDLRPDACVCPCQDDRVIKKY